MIAKAKVRFIRISPTKVNPLLKLIRGKLVGSSMDLLTHTNKRASLFLRKLLKSVVANAANKGVDTSDLNSMYISRVVVNSGPVLRRFRAAAFGRASLIRKRTSHIEIELDKKVKK